MKKQSSKSLTPRERADEYIRSALDGAFCNGSNSCHRPKCDSSKCRGVVHLLDQMSRPGECPGCLICAVADDFFGRGWQKKSVDGVEADMQ